jgi:hypothetical protein
MAPTAKFYSLPSAKKRQAYLDAVNAKKKKSATGAGYPTRDVTSGSGKKERIGTRTKSKDSGVVEGEIVDEGRTSQAQPYEDIEDAVIVPNSPAIGGARKALPGPRQFNKVKLPENKITEVPTKSVEGQRTRISTGRLAGNRLSWEEMQSGRYAGAITKGGEINRREGIKVGERPSTRASQDPEYKAQLLSKLENEVNGSTPPAPSNPVAGRQWEE